MSRKLGFLGKKGFDIFGRIKLFAPRMKWETLKTIVVNIKDTAKEYEIAFNGIKSSVENNDNFKQVGVKDHYSEFFVVSFVGEFQFSYLEWIFNSTFLFFSSPERWLKLLGNKLMLKRND